MRGLQARGGRYGLQTMCVAGAGNDEGRRDDLKRPKIANCWLCRNGPMWLAARGKRASVDPAGCINLRS